MAFELPTLNYAHAALGAKGMCEETLDIHYGKHHAAYVTALNGLVAADASLAGKSLEDLIKGSAAAGGPLFNNAGQHWNHSMYWLSLSPNGGGIPGKLEAKINADFGSVAKFKDDFKNAGITQFGSGWAWLILGNDGKLKITKSPNASSPLATGEGKTLLVCDVWEHAYYVDFRNRRPDFLANWLDKLANYEYAAAQL
jgi:Fe-Mn family superoxide dismutase